MVAYTVELFKLCMAPFGWHDNIIGFVPMAAMFCVFVLAFFKALFFRKKVSF